MLFHLTAGPVREAAAPSVRVHGWEMNLRMSDRQQKSISIQKILLDWSGGE